MSTLSNHGSPNKRRAKLFRWMLLAIPLLGACAGAVSLQIRSAESSQKNAVAAQQLEQKVRQLQGLLNSLTGVHIATSGNQPALLSLAEKVRMDNPGVTAVGRFQNIRLSEREAFQEAMAESGLFGFRIADLVDNKRVASPLRDDATPVSLLDPMTPELLPLLGSDLAADSELRDRLSIASEMHSSVEISIPDHWPAAGQLMILKPAHQTMQTPADSNLKDQEDIGGYFIIIDPEIYFKSVLDAISQRQSKGLTLSLSHDSEESLLITRHYPTANLFEPGWFAQSNYEQVFDFGDSSLILSIEGVHGVPKNQWVAIIIFILLAFACLFAGAAWLKQKYRHISGTDAFQSRDKGFSRNAAELTRSNRNKFTRQSVALLAGTLLLLPVLASLAMVISQRYQSETFEHESADIARVVAQRIRQINGLFNSLVSANYATSGDPPAFTAIAKQLRSDNSKITAVGRYQSVPIWTRETFERDTANTRPDGFFIADLVNGVGVPSPVRSIALPISLLEPETPALRPLIGTDLSSNRKLQLSLSKSVVQNSTVAIAIPDGWPAARQLMMLQPAYRGLSVPEQYVTRIQQSDGGYLLIIDPQNYLEGVVDMPSQSFIKSLSLALHKLNDDAPLASAQFYNENLFASEWFEAPRYQHSFALGDASLVLTIEGTHGIPRSHLMAAAAFIFLALAAFSVALLWLQERRRAATEKLLNLDALRTERDRSARTLHLISDAVVTVNRECIIQHVNTTGVQFLGAAQEKLIDNPLDDFLTLRYNGPSMKRFDALQLLNNMRSGGLIALDLVSVNNDANPSEFRSTVSLNRGSSKNLETAVFVFRDISAEKRLTAALEYHANHDALTGCANRYYFERSLEDLIRNRTTRLSDGALLCFDLDRFKVVNDTAGHAAGDSILMHMTKELKNILTPDDLLARLGGDEFAILMSDVDSAYAEQKAESVHQLFQTMILSYKDHEYPIRASIGLAHFSEVGNSPSEVLAAADVACYTAKDLGRNQLYIYRSGDEAIARRTSELEWLSLLRQALEHNRFHLYVQPLVSISDPETYCRYEFLLRLVDENGNNLQAGEIINAAERYGMMREIDRWVIDHALSIIARQTRNEQKPLMFAINLSGQSAADPTLMTYICDRVSRYQVDPTCLCFEITETAAISHFANAVALSQSIRDMGAQIALDDFGAGLSSFAYLKSLPINVLKIDGQFIRDITSNTVDQAMVRAIRDVARSMQITTVAEFVESQAIFDVLIDMGIDIAQGYHISKPMPVEDLLPGMMP